MPAMFIFDLPLDEKTGKTGEIGLCGEGISLGLGAVIRGH